MSEEKVEKMIQDKGLEAPRLTPTDIDAVIVGQTFTTLPSRKCMICELTLKNGYTVRGEAACVSPENFDQEIGEEISFKDARDKVWQLEGYLLQQKNPVVAEPGNYIDRLVAEHADLEEKVDKLSDFVTTGKFVNLSSAEQERMHRQLVSMIDYAGVLQERLDELV